MISMTEARRYVMGIENIPTEKLRKVYEILIELKKDNCLTHPQDWMIPFVEAELNKRTKEN